MLEVYLDKHAGFCSGVKRTLKKAFEIAGIEENIVSLGEIIHNPVIIKSLENAGILVVNNLEEINKDNHVIIRAHGVPPETEESLNSQKISYSDLTCPRVKNIHKSITEFAGKGYNIIIIGNPNHPEVTGHLGYAGEKGILIHTADEAEKFHTDTKTVIIAQTTISGAFFNTITGILKKNLKNTEIIELNTICSSVKKQQLWIRKYSEKCEAALIIGGRKSSNTEKLFNISKDITKTYWIQKSDELPEGLFSFSSVALTAGASTPNETIEEVLEIFRDRGAEIIITT